MADSTGHMVTDIPLLETKLYIPKWRHGSLSRPRLIERMDRGVERKLTLVSAPAGFGKSTLLAEWFAASPERAVAWVSLDQSDNDPSLLWTYVITALQQVQPRIGERALSLLHSAQPPSIELILTALINEMSAVEDDVTLVLDDYHVIDAEPVHHAIAFLLDHLPPRMHLVIASRSDPPLPLARLRGRGELTELGATDLRFTPDEASAFLNQVMDLDLSLDDVSALVARIEGWIAGLHLASLSLQGREDAHDFIGVFSDDNRYIADFLIEEVLQRQSERVRSFLLQTSILERLSGPLCDAVTAREDGSELIDVVERSNLFIVPLDERRQWYRYHHLFADVLHKHLVEEQPDLVAALHRRASTWYEQNGLRSDAIRHALAAEDIGRAADLIELAWPAMDGNFQSDRWLGWAKKLPGEVVRVRPVLGVAYAWALLSRGEMEAAEAHLKAAEGWLDPSPDGSDRPGDSSGEMVVADDEQFRLLPASIATARAYAAQALGSTSDTVKHARRSLDLLPEDHHLQRGQAGAILGLAWWGSGELEDAHRALADAMEDFRAAGNLQFAIAGTYGLADIRMVQGRLREAVRTYKRALQLASDVGEPALRGVADLYLGLADMHRERSDLEAAAEYLLESEELGEQAGLPDWRYRFCLAQAKMKKAEGDLEGALDRLDEAERLYFKSPVPDARPVAAQRARIWIEQGRIAEAREWVRKRGLSVDDDLSFLREFEHVTLARVLIAWHHSDRQRKDRLRTGRPHTQRSPIDQKARAIRDAAGLLDRLAEEAEEGGRTGSLIEILILQALVHRALDDLSGALDALERALTLAEPEGYARIFVDEGGVMRDLLRHAAARGIAGSYARHLLAGFNEPAPSGSIAAQLASDRLVEPLTPRELEILRLIATGMKNQEIADHLFISLSTVKRHIANTYGKLDVGHRTEAVVMADELGLL